MYLSQLVLDPRSRGVLSDLADPYQLHRTLMSAFPASVPAGERMLFRLEQQHSQPCLAILVQSQTRPNWTHLSERGYLLRPAAVKQFDLEPAAGQQYRFRLLANPTKRLKGSGDKDGPRIGLMREEQQLQWLDRKSRQHGFCVLAAQVTKIVQPDGWKREKGKNHRIRFHAVRFDGHLQVSEAAAFLRAWNEGIGSGKGFGFGLLSLARAG